MSGMGGNRVHVFPQLDQVAVITSANFGRRDAHALSDRLLEEQILVEGQPGGGKIRDPASVL